MFDANAISANLRTLLSDKSALRKIGAAILVVAVTLYGYQYLPLVKIGRNSSTYTLSDLNSFIEVNGWIADVVGGSGFVGKKDAFYTLILSGAQKEILKADKVDLPQLELTQAVESFNVPYRGLIAKIKTSLGKDYYRLFIEPMAVGSMFVNYYLNKEPNRAKAIKILNHAVSNGITEASTQFNVPSKEVMIPPLKSNERVFNALGNMLSSKESSRVFGELIEDAENCMIARPRRMEQNGIIVDAIVVKKMPIEEFISSELKTKGIPVNVAFYSVITEGMLAKLERSFLGVKVAEPK